MSQMGKWCEPVRRVLIPRSNFPNEATWPGLCAHLLVVAQPFLCRGVAAAVASASDARWRSWLTSLVAFLWCCGFGSMVLMRAIGPGYVNGPKCDRPEERDEDAETETRPAHERFRYDPDKPRWCDVCRAMQPPKAGHCTVRRLGARLRDCPSEGTGLKEDDRPRPLVAGLRPVRPGL